MHIHCQTNEIEIKHCFSYLTLHTKQLRIFKTIIKSFLQYMQFSDPSKDTLLQYLENESWNEIKITDFVRQQSK